MIHILLFPQQSCLELINHLLINTDSLSAYAGDYSVNRDGEYQNSEEGTYSESHNLDIYYIMQLNFLISK